MFPSSTTSGLPPELLAKITSLIHPQVQNAMGNPAPYNMGTAVTSQGAPSAPVMKGDQRFSMSPLDPTIPRETSHMKWLRRGESPAAKAARELILTNQFASQLGDPKHYERQRLLQERAARRNEEMAAANKRLNPEGGIFPGYRHGGSPIPN